MNRQPYQPYQPPVYRPQSYQQPAYPQQSMMMEAGYSQPGMISARYVTGREEAMAAQIMPDGSVWLFVDSARGRIYSKSVNPQTGFADFREFGAVAPQQEQQAAQYVPIEAFNALAERVKQLESAQGGSEGAM